METVHVVPADCVISLCQHHMPNFVIPVSCQGFFSLSLFWLFSGGVCCCAGFFFLVGGRSATCTSLPLTACDCTVHVFLVLPRPSRAPAQLALGRTGANCPEHPAVVVIVVVGVGVRVGVGVGVAAGVVVALVAAAEYRRARI